MTAICCVQSDTGEVMKLDQRVLLFADSRTQATLLVQDLWDAMPRGEGESPNTARLAEARRHLHSGDVFAARREVDACPAQFHESGMALIPQGLSRCPASF